MNDTAAVNSEAVQRRLRAIRERLAELSQVGDVSVERLETDWMVRAAIERVLTQLVELAVHINSHIATASGELPPAGYRESFNVVAGLGVITPELAKKIAPASGLRNVLVHDYLDADLSIITASVTEARSDFAEYVRQVAGWLERRASAGDDGQT